MIFYDDLRSDVQKGIPFRLLSPHSQEKSLSFRCTSAVPQTDTGGRVEDTKALGRTRVKELGKIVP